MRARYPDHEGFVERDGVRLGYEVFGSGEPTVLLMPTWTIIHSRFWKLQVPYLARRFRVITYDGVGNGRSDRSTDPARYTNDAQVADALAVLDACDTDRAVLVGLSRGCRWALLLAGLAPERVLGAVLVGSSPELPDPPPWRTGVVQTFLDPYPDDPEGFEKFNLAYWQDDWEDFARFWFDLSFPESRSTKAKEDAVGWARETGPDVLRADISSMQVTLEWEAILRAPSCPLLFVHGTDDQIAPCEVAERAADISGGRLVLFEGAGHIPLVRDPVRFNLILREFVDEVAAPPDPTAAPAPIQRHVWTHALRRPQKVLYLSSPIGLGHARRDLAIAQQLRELRPEIEVDWLAQHPVTAVLEAEGETIHPASEWLVSESAHVASEAGEHDLHCFQALRSMDEILVANFMIFQEVVEEGRYDLVVSDEAWDVDHFWHENPELKRGSHAWFTDFVGFLPMPDGGDHEVFLTADYNAEMIEHVERFPRIRDRAVFVGNPDDIVPDVFGPGLPKIRDWTEDHFRFAGYITGFTPPTADEAADWRAELGWAEDEKVCVVTVGGSGVGRHLLEKAIGAFPLARRAVPELRMVAVAGPRIDPGSLPSHPGLEVHGYVNRLHRLLSVCDLAVVQGGLTTTMELTAAKRPFLSFPLRNHFEQNHHVRHRLDQYGAGRCMDYAVTDPDALAEAIVVEAGATVDYRDVETDGARRAAELLAELI